MSFFSFVCMSHLSFMNVCIVNDASYWPYDQAIKCILFYSILYKDTTNILKNIYRISKYDVLLIHIFVRHVHVIHMQRHNVAFG